ncbi:MAG: hypothetical protein M3O50_11930 [Myxococcota bacterium]|nr:hypothetical protein [Myxococcota bacterium]
MPCPRALELPCLAFAFGLALLLAANDARAAGALEAVAQEAAGQLAQTSLSSVVVVAAPLASDQAAPKGDALAVRIAALVAGRLGTSARAHGQPASLTRARAVAGRASALLFVQVEITKGDLRVTIDVYRSAANAWDRIRNPPPSPVSHAFASEKLDAEVRSYLTPLVLELAEVHRVHHDEENVLAVACGDVDGDGGNELVLVSRTRVALGRVRRGKLEVAQAAAWSALSDRVPVPMREPLGGASIMMGAINVGSTDRGGVSLTADFVGHVPLSGVPVTGTEGVVCLIAQPSAGAFDGAPVECTPARDLKPKMAVPAPRFGAFAAATIADGQGNLRAVVIVREPSGRLTLKLGDAPAYAPDTLFGAQLALGDLDQDGSPEIATTNDAAGEDAVHVWSVPTAAPGNWRERLTLPAPAGVRAMAVCPPEEHGEPVLVAVVGDELWLLRSAVTAPAQLPEPAQP